MWYVVLNDGDTFTNAEGAILAHVPDDLDDKIDGDGTDVVELADVKINLGVLSESIALSEEKT